MPESNPALLQKKNFDFVDTIRCLSMLGIVFEHTELFGAANYASFYTSLLQVSVMQFFKFATVAFFLIAGFLINHKFQEYTPWQYLKNRFKSTIGPWAFWLNVLAVTDVSNVLFTAYFKYHDPSRMPSSFLSFMAKEYYFIIFETSFWFILNFLICIAILLLFKRYIYKVSFGVFLALVSLFYSVNLYHGWIRTEHTSALFGFVFFLWLGAYMNKHIDQLFGFIHRTSFIWLIGVTAVFFFMADLEIIYLKSLGSIDAYNTLRVTNILYSLSFFLILLKIGSIPVINSTFLPRKTTFGIYLIHYIVIMHLLNEILGHFHFHVSAMTAVGAISYSFLRYMLTYAITFVVVRLILLTKFKWAVGG